MAGRPGGRLAGRHLALRQLSRLRLSRRGGASRGRSAGQQHAERAQRRAAGCRARRGARHKLTDNLLPPDAKIRLALFLSRGQYTAGYYFDPATGKARGSAARGKDIYLQACASCHGLDGRGVGVGTRAPLGEIALKRPAEMFHKVRNGHPGAMNAALRPYPLASQVDVLSYIQTLPK